MAIFPREPPNLGIEYKDGMKKIAILDKYLANSTGYGHSYYGMRMVT